ncbi:MAG: IS1595 family transposase ISSsu9 [Verrucomicrobiae bacterium]|nr:IS1595 family transposase ISSsu9 [Verrucomicrobiae bacterium]
MKIVIIAAVAENGTIGDAGKIPWHISDDLKRFKRLTLGHPIIMGRKTYESLGKPLPGRRNVVLTRGEPIPNIECFSSLDEALQACTSPLPRGGEGQGEGKVFIIGGAEIYRLALPLADTMLLTHVHRRVDGDTKFPDFDRSQWREVHREETPEYSFVEYEKSVESSRSQSVH